MKETSVDNIESILQRLGGFAVQKFIFSFAKDSHPISLIMRNYRRSFVQDLWYANQRVIVECFNCDFFEKLTECIKIFYRQDSQFPPDIVKCCRLYALLREYNPTAILEIGCGTSSLVISSYLSDCGADTSAICIDSSNEWLNLTRSKIKQVSSAYADRIEWVEYSESGCAKVKNFVSNTSKLFVYLDAQLTDEDELQGMESLASILEGYSGNVAVLIDARRKAVWSINRLASALKCNLMIASNCLFPLKALKYDQAFADFHYIGSFTYVVSQGNVQSVPKQ